MFRALTVVAAGFTVLSGLISCRAASSTISVANAVSWLQPQDPFRIAGNVYYVGSRGLASYLITTPEGHILINSNLQSSVGQIRESVEKLNFKFSDIRILLISHAHWDHCAGSAEVKRLTGAKYMVMQHDVPVVESGGRTDPYYSHFPLARFPEAKVDRALQDGDEVRLGETVLIARLTPGHTRGCTTWTMQVQDGDRHLAAVIVGSPNVNAGYKLIDYPAYPEMAADYERTFAVLKSLPCDLFLGAHGDYFAMEKKLTQPRDGRPNPFVDPKGYVEYVYTREQAFRQELERQRAAKK
jgi:metallo-beta-lactamase class B